VIFWKTKKQATVSLSSAESEYVALSMCVSECLFIAQLLQDILKSDVIYPIKVYEDNQSCIRMANTLETRRTKHIDVKHHFLRDIVANGKVSLEYLSTDEQIADMLTKPLAYPKFEYFRSKINVINNL